MEEQQERNRLDRIYREKIAKEEQLIKNEKERKLKEQQEQKLKDEKINQSEEN